METKIHIYELPHIKLLNSLDTALNRAGVCALAAGDSCRIAFPRFGTSDVVIDDEAVGGGGTTATTGGGATSATIGGGGGGGGGGAGGGGGGARAAMLNGNVNLAIEGGGDELGSVVLYDALSLQVFKNAYI